MAGHRVFLFLLALLLAGAPLATAQTESGVPILKESAQAAPTQFWQEGQAAPEPGIQSGLGPGSAMQQRTGNSGFICTAAFLLRDVATGTYYLSTAGHCLVTDEEDPEPYTGAANPDKMHQQFAICVAGCIDNSLGIGTYVTLKPDEFGHPVLYARSAGVGADFGVLRLPANVHDLLRPELPMWGGPTGANAGTIGDLYVHFGHGSYCCPVTGSVASRTPADQGRVAVSIGVDVSSFSAVGSISGGDSGSGISRGVISGEVITGAEAVGVITHGLVGVGTTMSGTVLSKGIRMVQETTGVQLELVKAGDPLPPASEYVPPETGTGQVAITSPTPGTTVTAGQQVSVLGGAQPPESWLPGMQVQVAVDDPTFATNSRLPLTGNASWQATWYTAGEALGNHVLRARLVDGDGNVLAQDNVTVNLAKASTKPPSSSTTTTQAGGDSSTASQTTSSSGPAPALPKATPLPTTAWIGFVLLALAVTRRRSTR